jgi:hypothetical protein
MNNACRHRKAKTRVVHIVPDGQNRVCTAWFRSSTQLNSERLPSYRELREASLAGRFPSFPVIHSKRRVSHTRSLDVIPRHLVKDASAPLELDPSSTRAFRRRATNEPEMRPANVCNPHVKDKHPQFSDGSRRRFEGNPRTYRRTVLARCDRPLQPLPRRLRRRFGPAQACHEESTSGVPVTDRALHSSTPA